MKGGEKFSLGKNKGENGKDLLFVRTARRVIKIDWLGKNAKAFREALRN